MDMLTRTAAAHGELPALRVKRDGKWTAITWRDYRDQVRLTARGLMSLGLGAGECITITGMNCPEWFLADLGAIHAGGMPAGIYATNTAEQCWYIAHHCEARVAVVEDETQLAKFLAVRDRLPALRGIVLMHGEPPANAGPGVYSWRALLERGAAVSDAALDARIAAQRPDDVCTLIYTSGTTGEPKGVMLSHDNLVFIAESARALGVRAGEEVVSYLPLSHIAEQTATLFTPLAFGVCTCFAESMETLGDTLREIRPSYFVGVPRVWEKIQERMQAAGAASPALRRRIVRWARGLGLKAGYAEQRRGGRPALYPVADKLVFQKVRARLGLERARFLITAAAPISRHTLEFFLSLGMPICELYGLSECTGPTTLSTPEAYRTGKAGRALPGTELRIAEDGEICIRGRHVFKGYFKNPSATAETLDDDGWLHTGDIGTLDAEGFLQITDRKKELIITAGGENVAPQYVEGVLKSIPVVSQAVVVGDRQRYLAVLLTLDAAKVPHVAEQAGSPARDVESAVCCERFTAYLHEEIQRVNGTLARVQTVKRFAVIPNEFTVEGGELTPTMKLRRKVIGEKYREVIERLFA
jgi:long-subunit acyl-CoA synthetase (AMP-forming)